MKNFNLTITLSQKKIFQDKVISEITVPAKEGWLTVLAGHAPLLAILKKGKIKIIKKENNRQEFEIEEGFIEVTEQGVTILAKKA
ncbi:MAG: ATP synthase F1 subunit epsilon [Candidatus Omnitrophota bacterium]|nr:ATP synthase F1 subunit epsilon [Candidatus Omnitrophota bacterium]